MDNTLLILSPAKVNLRLEILKKREDGYHEIRTIFQKISLHDRLFFSLKTERGIRIATDCPGLPTGKRNLVYQAVRFMVEKSDFRGGVDIKIEKKIPLGAGLGGGSSNAAVALSAMNRLLHLNLTQKELMGLGLGIGADVPFFIFKGAAIASGIGERLRKVELPKLWYVLIYPNFEVSTRWAYQNFVLTKTKYHFNLHKLLETPEKISRLLKNDLQGVVSAKYPEIDWIRGMLISVGAMGAMMTGSGPTVFGLFAEEDKTTEAFQRLRKKVRGRGWRVIKAHSIP